MQESDRTPFDGVRVCESAVGLDVFRPLLKREARPCHGKRVVVG